MTRAPSPMAFARSTATPSCGQAWSRRDTGRRRCSPAKTTGGASPSCISASSSRTRRVSPHILLDLSRLLWQPERSVPTGIERVELAYARHFIAGAQGRLDFAAMALGRFGAIAQPRAAALVEARGAQWSGTGDTAAGAGARRHARRIRLEILLKGEGA